MRPSTMRSWTLVLFVCVAIGCGGSGGGSGDGGGSAQSLTGAWSGSTGSGEGSVDFSIVEGPGGILTGSGSAETSPPIGAIDPPPPVTYVLVVAHGQRKGTAVSMSWDLTAVDLGFGVTWDYAGTVTDATTITGQLDPAPFLGGDLSMVLHRGSQ